MKKQAEAKQPGFTLLELIMAVVIVGILASIAVPRYMRVVERGRSVEARNILGMIRDAEAAYFLEFDVYTNNLLGIGVAVPAACNTSYYYRYSVVLGGGSTSFIARANRCTAAGRTPNGPFAYTYALTNAGVLSCSVANML